MRVGSCRLSCEDISSEGDFINGISEQGDHFVLLLSFGGRSGDKEESSRAPKMISSGSPSLQHKQIVGGSDWIGTDKR